MENPRRLAAAALAGAALLAASAPPALAHCDTLDGPVVADARRALEAGDVGPALKWVEAGREAEVREAFAQAASVRTLPAARPLADRFFFETLVRIHREGEGAPYTGLKPAGSAVDPAIAATDRALDRGEVEPLVHVIAATVEEGLRRRFARATAARARAADSVEAGRAFVHAYVELVHYAEGVRQAATAGTGSDAHTRAPHAGVHDGRAPDAQ
jgi:hypothetical protein